MYIYIYKKNRELFVFVYKHKQRVVDRNKTEKFRQIKSLKKEKTKNKNNHFDD